MKSSGLTALAREGLRLVMRSGPEGLPRWVLGFVHLRPVVVSGLVMARADSSLRSLLARFSRIDVLVIDDWVMAPLSEPERRDFGEICEDRYQVRSTILTSQLPVSKWHEQIGDPTLADGILDRLVHNAHRIASRCVATPCTRIAGIRMRNFQFARDAGTIQDSRVHSFPGLSEMQRIP